MQVSRIVGMTDAARAALNGGELVCDRYPFRVGREGRTALRHIPLPRERRTGSAVPNNDVYLLEAVSPTGFQIDREHFQIEFVEGRFFLTDRGSARGTGVDGRRVGGAGSGGRIELFDQTMITVGDAQSPFVFRFLVESR